MNDRITIYRYGLLAWVWRFFLAGFLAGGSATFALGFRSGEIWLFVCGLALLAPALFFGTVLAVRVDRVGRDGLHVQTLLFFWRRLRIYELGRMNLRREYQDEHRIIDAPRLWISVRRSVPIYLDLLGQIPSGMAFAATFNVRESALPGSDG